MHSSESLEPQTNNLSQVVENYKLDVLVDSTGTDKGSIHSYLKYVYEPIFEILKNQPHLRLLEIGIFRGGSLAMWKIAMPNTEIHAIDIDVSNIRNKHAVNLLNQGLLNLTQGDPYFHRDLISTLGKFDIIIDDGPHTIESQLRALDFVRHLAEGGTLVIEDVNIKDRKVKDLFRALDLIEDFAICTLNLVHKKGRYDDVLILITRNPEISLWVNRQQKRKLNYLLKFQWFRIALVIISPLPQSITKIVRRIRLKSL